MCDKGRRHRGARRAAYCWHGSTSWSRSGPASRSTIRLGSGPLDDSGSRASGSGNAPTIDALSEDTPGLRRIHCRRRRNALIGSRAAQSRSERRLRAASCRSGGTSHRFTSTLVRDEATESLTPRGRALREEFDHDFSRTLIWYDRSLVLGFPYVSEKIDWKGNMVTRKVVNEVNRPDPFTICHQ